MANNRATRRTSASASPTAHHIRAANKHVEEVEHIAIDLPVIGSVKLPSADQLAYFGAVGVLVALEVIDWPVALLIAAGHALATQQHHRVLREFGEGLETAE